MKIVTNREKFLAAFQIAAGIAPSRSPKEVLNNVKIDATDGRVVLMATDLEAGIRLVVEDVQIIVPGRALLNVQRVGNILREASDETLSLETSENTLDIQGGHSEFHLPLANPDEFPSVVEFAEDSYFEVSARLFKELVKRTIFATDNESTRYQLGGVLFEMDGDHDGCDGWKKARMHERQGHLDRGFQKLGYVDDRADENAELDGQVYQREG